MNVYAPDQFRLPLPPHHRFPMEKYRLLRLRLIEHRLVAPEEILIPPPATDVELLRVHDPDYLRRVVEGRLDPDEVREIGLPWSPELVERSRRSCGATIEACRSALVDGVAANLAGGTHHARPDRGAGFCVFNDAAVAARALQAAGKVRRVVVIDADVHQGDGTAEIFADDPSVLTFSIHGARNYPLRKPAGDIDVGLGDGTTDADYLEALDLGVRAAIDRAGADLAIYLAGADPFEGDRLGRLAITKAGLARRDRLVLGHCKAAGLPVAIAMAGGYARDINDTVHIQVQTIREALRLFG